VPVLYKTVVCREQYYPLRVLFWNKLTTLFMQIKTMFYTKLLGFLCLMLASAPAYSITYSFIGGWNSTWVDSSAWSPAGIPGADDDVIFNLPTSQAVYLPGDVTLRSLTITGYATLNGSGWLTVTESFVASHPVALQIKFKLAAGATGLLDNAAFTGPFGAGFQFNGNIEIDGNMTLNASFLSLPACNIKGSLTVLKGDLFGTYSVAPSGVLTLNSGSNPIQIGKITNNGTLHWQSGRINLAPQELNNAGVWNISASDTLQYEALFQEQPIINTGQINIAPNVARVAILKGLRNLGNIALNGPTELSLYALDHSGTISGGAGSALLLSGNFFGTGNIFQSGSTVSVPRLRTEYLTSLDIKSGVNLASIEKISFNDGSYALATALPAAAEMNIRGGFYLNVDQEFSGPALLDGASFSGTGDIQFSGTQVRLLNAYFAEETKTVINAGAIVEVQNVSGFDLTNNGTMNWLQDGQLTFVDPGFVNNSIVNISTDSAVVMSASWNSILWKNNGTLNATGRICSIFCGLDNQGEIALSAEGGTLEIGNSLLQNGIMKGDASNLLRVYGGSTANVFTPVAQTIGFGKLEFNTGVTTLKAGTALTDIGQIRMIGAEVVADIVLPPASNYLLENTLLRLKTTFEPQTVLQLTDSDIEGSGNLRIGTGLNWNGGTLDVPVRVFAGATANIRENNERPIISAPFTNDGTVTLSGGIIEINTGFFKNNGTWTVNSEEDVIMDGFTPFGNDGVFAICGNQPIQISFNIPFNNNASGFFEGTGSYTFNAGFSNAGTVEPGCSPGTLRILDNFSAAAGVNIEIEGGQAGEYDKLIVNGNMNAAGVLHVTMPNGASFSGALKVIETLGSFNGVFSQVILPPNCTMVYENDGISIISDGTVSTGAPQGNSAFRLLPTLATDVVRITFGAPLASDDQLLVFDMQGRPVRSIALAAGSTTTEVALQDLTAGTYFVRLATAPAWTERFAKLGK
jgi:hypothetical protein